MSTREPLEPLLNACYSKFEGHFNAADHQISNGTETKVYLYANTDHRHGSDFRFWVGELELSTDNDIYININTYKYVFQ